MPTATGIPASGKHSTKRETTRKRGVLFFPDVFRPNPIKKESRKALFFYRIRAKIVRKKQNATLTRGFLFLWRAYRSLGCQSQSAKIMSSTSPYTVSYSIFLITLLSFICFRIVYAVLPKITTSFLYKLSSLPRHIFDKLHKVLAFLARLFIIYSEILCEVTL